MTVAQFKKMLKSSRRKSPRAKADKSWSEPEKRYFHGVLRGVGKYESERIRITPEFAERHVYTPDFTTTFEGLDCQMLVYHEVKGSYRLQSQDAARIRFIVASVMRVNAYFVWAKERKNHRWDIEVFRNGVRIDRGRNVAGFMFNENEEVVWRQN